MFKSSKIFKKNNKRTIFLSNFASCGGTLIVKFLSRSNQVVVLNEIHPRHNVVSDTMHAPTCLWEQLYSRYPALVSAEKLDQRFIHDILQIRKWANENDKHLVLRDWAHGDYFGGLSGGYQVFEKLVPKLRPVKVVLYRDPIDAFLSATSSGFISCDFSEYCENYFDFLNKRINNNYYILNYDNFVVSQLELISFLSHNYIELTDCLYDGALDRLGFSGSSGRSPKTIQKLKRRRPDTGKFESSHEYRSIVNLIHMQKRLIYK